MLKKIIIYVSNKIFFYNDNKINRYLFVIFFNIVSLIFRSKNKIYFKDNYYYNSERRWRFFHKRQGLYSYSRGFEKRKNELKKIYLLEDIKVDHNDVVIDIGANNGDFYLCFDKKINYNAFEPSPIVFSNLEYNIKNQNLFNLGVSDKDNENVDFFLSDEFGDSSILSINKYSKKIKIKTTSLDSIIEKIKRKIKLIKVEAEGFEPEILRGLNKYINYVEYITIDCGFERGTNQDSTIAECSNYLIKNNFKMINFGAPRIVCLFKNQYI